MAQLLNKTPSDRVASLIGCWAESHQLKIPLSGATFRSHVLRMRQATFGPRTKDYVAKRVALHFGRKFWLTGSCRELE